MHTNKLQEIVQSQKPKNICTVVEEGFQEYT